MVDDEPRQLQDWAALLKRNWEARARSESRDFYVASHPGWKDPAAWNRQAELDTTLFLHGLEPDWLARAEVLEIGCGVGRLAPSLLQRVASYTGVDVSASMVEEARGRHGEPARFFVSDGLRAPDEIRDRRYDLVLSIAVFIHCPREVVEALVTDAIALLADGGRLRCQLRADERDPTGLEAPPELAETAHQDMLAMQEAATPADLALIEGHYYMGHPFRYDEAAALFAPLPGALTLRRFDLAHIYADFVKDASAPNP